MALIWVLLCAVGLAATAPAAAQQDLRPQREGTDPAPTAGDAVGDARTEEPNRDDLDRGETLELTAAVAAGLEAERQGDHDKALDLFLDAYSIFPHANILLSISRVCAARGDDELAVRGYRRVLERRPEIESRGAIRGRIRELDERIASADPPADPNQGEEPERIEQTEQPAADAIEAPRPDPPRESFPRSPTGWGGIAATAVGSAGLLAAAGISASIESDFDDLAAAAEADNRALFERIGADIEAQQTGGRILFYGGLGLIGTGVAAMALDWFEIDVGSLIPVFSDEERAELYVAPIDERGASIRWTIRF